MMKAVVFGASGGVGYHVVQQALKKDHAVRGVYRSSSIPRLEPNLEVAYVGDFFDRRALAEIIAGADAVISCLGARRKSPKNPWAKVTSPLDLMERFSRSLIEAMTAPAMPKRLVIVSAAGVGPSAPLVHPVLRFVFNHSTVGLEYKDLAKMEDQIERSKLDWTIVRPVTLTTGQLTNTVKLCGRYGLTDSISRADVASFLLRCLEESTSSTSRTPMIRTT
jgi:putative NADH-flavin reductase